MQVTTEGIVLSIQRRGDSSSVLHVYTRASGRVNYMVYGAGSKRHASGQFLPLSLVELTVDMHPNRDLGTVKESRLMYVPTCMDTDVRRQSVAMFIAEVLFRTMRHPMADELLFERLVEVVHEVDTADDIENVHLRFLVSFAACLGFAIDAEQYPELLREPHTRKERQELLLSLCQYFHEHIDDWQQPKSLDVLHELFD